MRVTVLLAVLLFTLPVMEWQTDFAKARQQAKEENKFILLNFSGSDWCGPCIRMHKEIFESPSFLSFAGTRLVLLNADFPRLKKHQLPKELQQQNNQLADKYNSKGDFPCTVLLDADGNLLHRWEGYPPVSPEKFVEQLKELTHESD